MTALLGLETESVERAPDRVDARAFLEQALSRRSQRPLAITVPAPVSGSLAMLERLRRGTATHLHDERRVLTTLGATRLARLEGASRFSDARAAYEHAREAIAVANHERTPHGGPIWTLGFAFAAGTPRDVWAPFGDGLLTLPRWTYRAEGSLASLTLVVDADEPLDPTCALAELDSIWEALRRRDGAYTQIRPARARHVEEDRWTRSLADVHERIVRGVVDKIVVARRSTVTSEADIDPVRVLRRLERPGATMFCVRQGGAAFVGASPERLFRKRARRVDTEAIAGTASLERDPSATRLFASTKDVHEHQLVVEGITSALARLRAEVSVGARSIRTLGAIAHLATPIEAHLTQDVSAFEILEALHPTPAVGGVPRDAAARWIAEHEPDRGWYAGPLGWVDAEGNGEVHVALRSALIAGARAFAYAGCGVVEASDSHAEYVETALKLAPMLGALGVVA